MGNSASGMLIAKQPKKVVIPQDKKIDKIIGDIINQIIANLNKERLIN